MFCFVSFYRLAAFLKNSTASTPLVHWLWQLTNDDLWLVAMPKTAQSKARKKILSRALSDTKTWTFHVIPLLWNSYMATLLLLHHPLALENVCFLVTDTRKWDRCEKWGCFYSYNFFSKVLLIFKKWWRKLCASVLHWADVYSDMVTIHYSNNSKFVLFTFILYERNLPEVL